MMRATTHPGAQASLPAVFSGDSFSETHCKTLAGKDKQRKKSDKLSAVV